MRGRRTSSGQQWSAESLENIIADIRLIQQNSVPGKTRHDLRHITTPMREIAIEDRLLHAWKKIGLPKKPTIPCLVWTGNGVNQGSIAIGGGAEDTPQEHGANPFGGPSGKATGVTEAGKEVLLPAIGLSWTVRNGTSSDVMSNKDDPFVEGSRPIAEYFRDCIIYFEGLKISRAEIVQHISYGRDGVHYSREGIKDPKKQSALEFLANGVIHGHDVVFYVYLSIAQALARAPDISLFVETAEKLLAERK